MKAPASRDPGLTTNNLDTRTARSNSNIACTSETKINFETSLAHWEQGEMDEAGAPSRAWWEPLSKDSDEWNELKDKCLIVNPYLAGAELDFWIRQVDFDKTFESWATLPEDRQNASHVIGRAKYAMQKLGEKDGVVQLSVTKWEEEYCDQAESGTADGRADFEKKMKSIVDLNISKLRASGILTEKETLEDKYIKETLEKKYAKDGEKRNDLARDTTVAQPPVVPFGDTDYSKHTHRLTNELNRENGSSHDTGPEESGLLKRKKAMRNEPKHRGRTSNDPVSPPFKRQALSNGRYKATGVKIPEVTSHVANEVSTSVSLSTTAPTIITAHANNVALNGFQNGHQGDNTMSATDGHDDGGQVNQAGENTAEVTKKKKRRRRGKGGKKQTKNDTMHSITNNANTTNGIPSDTFQSGHQVDGEQMEGLDQACEAGEVVRDPASEAKNKSSKMTLLANSFEKTKFPYMADGKEVGENQQVDAKVKESQEAMDVVDDDPAAWDDIYGIPK